MNGEEEEAASTWQGPKRKEIEEIVIKVLWEVNNDAGHRADVTTTYSCLPTRPTFSAWAVAAKLYLPNQRQLQIPS